MPPLLLLQVQTNGDCEPKAAVQDALKDLQGEFREMSEGFGVRVLVGACNMELPGLILCCHQLSCLALKPFVGCVMPSNNEMASQHHS